MENESSASKDRPGVCCHQESKGLGGVSAAPGTGCPVHDPVGHAVREHLGLRSRVLQFLAEHRSSVDDGHLHLRLGGTEAGNGRIDTRIHGINSQCCKSVIGMVVTGAVGSLVGWYHDDLFECFDRELGALRFGPTLLWVLVLGLIFFLLSRLFPRS